MYYIKKPYGMCLKEFFQLFLLLQMCQLNSQFTGKLNFLNHLVQSCPKLPTIYFLLPYSFFLLSPNTRDTYSLIILILVVEFFSQKRLISNHCIKCFFQSCVKQWIEIKLVNDLTTQLKIPKRNRYLLCVCYMPGPILDLKVTIRNLHSFCPLRVYYKKHITQHRNTMQCEVKWP